MRVVAWAAFATGILIRSVERMNPARAMRGQAIKVHLFRKLFLAGSVMLAGNVHAYQTLEGYVTLVEPTYMPTLIQFSMDVGSSLCPVNSWLRWSKANIDSDTAAGKSFLSTLLAAQ